MFTHHHQEKVPVAKHVLACLSRQPQNTLLQSLLKYPTLKMFALILLSFIDPALVTVCHLFNKCDELLLHGKLSFLIRKCKVLFPQCALHWRKSINRKIYNVPCSNKRQVEMTKSEKGVIILISDQESLN